MRALLLVFTRIFYPTAYIHTCSACGQCHVVVERDD